MVSLVTNDSTAAASRPMTRKMHRPLPTLPWKLRRRMALVTSIVAAILLTSALISPRVRADAFLPAPHQVFQGVAGQPISQYQQATGKHPAVYQVFAAWGEYLPAIFADAAAAQSRLMIHIQTASGPREMITPAAIAHGNGDGWLIALNNAIAASGRITYVRLMAEMDNANNFYAAYNADGSHRDGAHSSAAFKQAWRRATLILRGGSVANIDAELHRLSMPPLHAGADLPRPQVAMLWVPMTGGSPDIPGNEPANYWPGRRWVDWVGTDFYSKFPNFARLNAFYAGFRGLPFVFGEWALWGGDDPGFVRSLFSWVHAHSRVRMLVYNQGENPAGPFRLSRYPAAARALRGLLAGTAFPAFTPDWMGSAARRPLAHAPRRLHRPSRRHRHRHRHRARSRG